MPDLVRHDLISSGPDRSHLRSGLTERSFRKYESIIKTILTAWPQVSVLDPEQIGLSKETLSARLRDALRSLAEYGWPTDWDSSSIRDAYPQLIVAQHADKVLVGSRTGVRELTAGNKQFDHGGVTSVPVLSGSDLTGVAPGNNSTTGAPPIIADNPSVDCLHAYALLATLRLPNLPRMKVINLVDKNVLLALSCDHEFDIAVMPDASDPNSFIIL